MTDSSAAAQGQRQRVVSLARCTPQQATSRGLGGWGTFSLSRNIAADQ